MSGRRVLAVVPAAGRGTRAGGDVPKIFLPIADGVTVWSQLRERIAPHVGRIVLVLSPEGDSELERLGAAAMPDIECSVTTCLQATPRGMGHAVFCAEPHWRGIDDVLVVWGDQLGLSSSTIARVVERQRATPPPSLTVALVETERPYVRYDFDPNDGVLQRVRQSREGDDCGERGLCDVGCFCLSSAGLAEAWAVHTSTSDDAVGRRSGELNFLPFLAYLSRNAGWRVERVPVADPDERLGINTAVELELFRARLAARRPR